MTGFADKPHCHRLAVINAVADYGGSVVQYCGDGFTVAMPRHPNDAAAIRFMLAAYGWTLAKAVYFPLGTDSPPYGQRHAMPGYQPIDTENPGAFLYEHYTENAKP